MWTCPKCESNVGDQFAACQSCGTGVDGAVAPPPPPKLEDIDHGLVSNGVAPPPPELKPVVPPPPSPQENLIRSAKAGAIYGALYGAMYSFIYVMGLATLLRGNFVFPEGTTAALGQAMLRGTIYGIVIGVPVAVIFRFLFPYRPPRDKS